MPHLSRALASPTTRLLAISLAQYADIVYQPMTVAARLSIFPGQRPVLYLADDADEADQCRAFAEARLTLVTRDPDAAVTARRAAHLSLVS